MKRDYLSKPGDSYTRDGVYWADLPIAKRIGFVSSVDAAEIGRELSGTWAMIKKNPLSPISYYFRNMVIPGAGLGLEGYVLFSIGNLQPLFAAAFPLCWGTPSKKSPNMDRCHYLSRGLWYHRRANSGRHSWRLDWSTLGSDSGCHHYVYWSHYVGRVLGRPPKMVGLSATPGLCSSTVSVLEANIP